MLCFITTIRERTLRGLTTTKSIKWADPTRVKNLHKSIKWMDPKKGIKILVPKMDEPQKGQKPTQVHKVDGPQKRDQDSSHKVDGPHTGQKLTQVYKMDEPHEGSRF